MSLSKDAFHEKIAVSIRQKIEALERPGNPLSLEQWAKRLLELAPDLYAEPPIVRSPTVARPHTDGKIEVMSMRVLEAGCSPFHPADPQLDATYEAEDRRVLKPTDAGNGLPGSVEADLEWSDIDHTDGRPGDDPREPLADKVRRWLDEQWEIRARWRAEKPKDEGPQALQRGAAA